MQIFAIVLSLASTAVAVVMSVRAVQAMSAVIRVGQPVRRTDDPGSRTVTMFKETFLHTRMLQWTLVGVMHWFVYLAFLVLSGAVFQGYFQLFSPDFQLPVIGHFLGWEWLQEALGVLGTVGIVVLIVYRQRHHPRSLGRKSRFFGSTQWQAYFVEAFVLLEGSLILFIRGAERNLGLAEGNPDGDYSALHFPVSSLFGEVLYPSGESSIGTLETIIISIAMLKIVSAMIWVMVISSNLTMGVAWHRFTAWPNIWFKRESSGRTALGAVKPLTIAGERVSLDDIEELDEDAGLGVGRIEDFSWKGLLDFTTCTECGRCQSQCPAWNTEKPLSPKLLITALRDHAYAKAPYLQASEEGREAVLAAGGDTLQREVDRPLVGDTGDGWFYMPEDGSAVIDPEVLWNCTSCGACVQQCPVDIEHVDHIIDMRRYQMLVEANFPAELNQLFKGLESKGNPWNMSPQSRMDWAQGLDVKVVGEDVESLDEVDWLFWVGCAGAYEDRAKKTTRAVAELLNIAGIDFAVLGNGETCTGDPARRAGNEFVFQGLATQNAETLTEHKAKKVVASCAHCFNTLKNEYSEFGVQLEVVHHTQLLNRLVREGKLTPVADGAGAHKRSITYHDPCYLGRHNEVYSPPRELLQILPGAEVTEMPRNSERSFCCGAGGARMWMEENTGERINMNRTDEAVATGADQIAVGCPFCRVMLSDGLTMKQSKDEAREEVEVLDVAQMLLSSVKGEQATKMAPGSSNGTAAPAAKKAAPVAAPAEKKAEPEDEATKAEPESGDVTQTEDTVTDTEDVGPAAKASGGSSLFDTPADEPATAAEDKPVAEEAEAAAPASSGGSLFDVDDADPAAVSDDADPAAVSDDDQEPDAKPAEPSADLGGGGSLFDISADEPAAEPDAASQPESETTPEPSTEAKEPEPSPAPAPSAGSGGDTSTLGRTGSMFDIAAPPARAATSAPETEAKAEPEPEAKAEPRAGAEGESQPEPKAKAAPATQAAAGSSGASTPGTEIPEGGSLFDLEAPATQDTPQAAPEAAEPAAEPEAEAEPEAKAEPEVEAKVGAEAEPEAEPEPEPSAAPPAPAASSTGASTPGTEIPEGGSLFDLEAPATQDTPQAAPEAAEPEQAAQPERAREPEPESTPQAEPEAAEPGSTRGGDAPSGAEVSAAASRLGSEEPDQSESEPKSEPESEPEPEPEPEPEAETKSESESEPAKRPAANSGPAHEPKTDVEIGDGSLFDL